MKPQITLLASAAVAAVADPNVPGATSFVVPTAFPTTVYSSYYGEDPVTIERPVDIAISIHTDTANQSSLARPKNLSRPSLIRS